MKPDKYPRPQTHPARVKQKVAGYPHYDQFAKGLQIERADARSFAEIVLHVFARVVRYHILFGRRLMIVVQSDDPRIRFENLAPVAADWIPHEWLAQNRGL